MMNNTIDYTVSLGKSFNPFNESECFPGASGGNEDD